jgi:phage terminase large subunit-like protein
VVIDTNACVRWAFSNVELKFDWNDNCKPIKAGNDQLKKIDPVIAMLQALGAYLLSPEADLKIC